MCRLMMVLCMIKHDDPSSLEDSELASSSISSITTNPQHQGRFRCTNHSVSSQPPATITTTTSIETTTPTTEATTNPKPEPLYPMEYSAELIIQSSSFEYDNLKQVPTISYNEIILPGSEIQKRMAFSMKQLCNSSLREECVICMEEFCTDNPRMPTVCACGENKTYFHLSCLYQWIQSTRRRRCPTCRKQLKWKEF